MIPRVKAKRILLKYHSHLTLHSIPIPPFFLPFFFPPPIHISNQPHQFLVYFSVYLFTNISTDIYFFLIFPFFLHNRQHTVYVFFFSLNDITQKSLHISSQRSFSFFFPHRCIVVCCVYILQFIQPIAYIQVFLIF